jgi:hypothetical protein
MCLLLVLLSKSVAVDLTPLSMMLLLLLLLVFLLFLSISSQHCHTNLTDIVELISRFWSRKGSLRLRWLRVGSYTCQPS